MDDVEVEVVLDDFNIAFFELCREISIVKASFWHSVECREGVEFGDLLWRPELSRIDRDTRLLTSSRIDRLQDWDEDDVPMDVAVDGAEPGLAPSLGYAFSQAKAGRNLACVVIASSPMRGFRPVVADSDSGELFFVAKSEDLPEFWRRLFRLEKVKEGEFFDLASKSFPRLQFGENLDFRRFSGGYLDLRDRVIDGLAVLNDDFLAAYSECAGVTGNVVARLKSLGVNISPESVNTRARENLMKLRDVEFEGATYRCEWHLKIEPHRNRIHFAFMNDDSLLIGIFVEHLGI
jgi:hypothetical protein